MIFVILGSQKFQFNRLLIKIDELIDIGIIKEEVFAQIGYSDYIPQKYKYIDFMPQDKFKQKIEEASYVITHAGTGAIISALKKNKKVIAIPRLSKYGEHIDDHQIQLIDEFTELNFIEPVYEIKDLAQAIEIMENKEYNTYRSNTDKIIDSINEFIRSE